MKNLFRVSFVLALFSMLLFSCSKDESVAKEEQKVKITFSANKAGVSTKTAAVEGDNSVSYKWTDEDVTNIKLFSVGVDDEGKEVLTEVANPTVTKVSDTKLTISAEVAPNTTYSFRAILCDPSSYTGSGNNYSTRKPKTKAKQFPNGYDNFDPTADILVSDDMEVQVGASEEEVISTSALEMIFRRQVVINKMTLKNLTPGERVNKVIVTSTAENKDIQGYLLNGVMTGQGKVITLEYNDVEIPSNGEFPVYFVSMNNTEIPLKIDVTTNQKNYTKSFAEGKSINFNLGQFTRFSVTLNSGTPITTVPNGTYFITGIKDSQVYAAKAYVSGNNLSTLQINVNSTAQSIGYVTDIEDCIFTLTRLTEGDYSGKYTIQDANGLYLYAAGGNGTNPSNHLKGESTPDNNGNAYWTVSKNSDGTYDIESAGNADRKIMRFNGTDLIFSCYGSGQNAITIYPASWCTIDTTPHITIEESERTKNVPCAATTIVFNYIANRYAPDPTVTITSDVNSIIDGTPVVADGTISVALVPNTANTEKTATLQVSGEGLTSPVTLTIIQEAYVNYVSGNESFDLTKKTYTTSENSVTWNGTSVTINNSGTNATNYLGGDSNNRTSSRFYTGNTLTISPKSGYTITSIVFTATSDSYATVLKNSTWTNASASVSGNTVTVIPTNGNTTISATIGGTCGFTRIVVNYLTEGSGGSGSNALLTLDLTTKEFGTSNYNTSTEYGDWKIVNGANNNKGWEYFKMGGKSATLSSANPCYIYSTEAIEQTAGSVTVHLPSGSLSKSGMSVNSWGLYVYSDEDMTTQIDYVAGGTITNAEGTFTFVPSTGVTWSSGSYFKVSWDLANTTTTNGIVCVDKIIVYSTN